MDDDKNPNDPNAIPPSPDEEQPEDEQPRHRPISHLDELMSAKDKAEKEAARWDEIESRGQPVPSAGQPDAGMTQPVIPEPPHQPEDTATGQQTPPEGVPPVRPERPKTAAERRGLPATPPFPHPTDQPAPPPPGPEPPTPVEPARMPLGFEPPMPDEMDQPQPQPPARPEQHLDPRYEQPSEELPPVRLDDHGMPLPRRVPPRDLDATTAGPSSYRDNLGPSEETRPQGTRRPDLPQPQPGQPQRGQSVPPAGPPQPPRSPQSYSRAPVGQVQPPPAVPSRQQPVRRPQPQRQAARRPKKRSRRSARRPLTWGCVAQIVGLALVAGLVMVMLSGGAVSIYYAQVTAPAFKGINNIADLQQKALQFQTTRIRDRDGNVLYEINDPQGGFRNYVTLDEVSPWVIVATVATEERNYFTNPGFSIPAIARAVYQNLKSGDVVSGASTITQQLTRALLLPEEQRTERSYQRKIKEVFLAAELGRRFSKRDILELYLNQIYYGNLAYGIEAASQTYFGKSAKDLNLAEASFLAGLPQAPAVYDPVNDKAAAIGRQQTVLGLMLQAGCIDTGDSGLQLPCTTQADITAAQPDLVAVATKTYNAPAVEAKYPHWVVYVQQLLEADPAIGPSIYTSGYDVYTTIDPRIQDVAQQQVETTLSGLQDRHVTNASVVVSDVHTGAILAMVGSRDFNDTAISGQVNVAQTPQQPGSSIKPFTYLAAFRAGWNPATVIWDVPISYDIPGFGTYAPVNYDGQFRGPVSVRYAIANSLNVPAVLTLDHVGVPALLQVLNDVGVTSLGDPSNPNNYGLSLTLGAGEVTLLEWTNAFATIGNGGVYHPLYAIDRIERNGQVIEGYPYQVPEGRQAIDPGQDFLMQSILSDKEARIPEFGANSPISPPYPAGAKTGTTNDFRDNWTMGFTTEVAVGVWVGNTDNSPMLNVTGVTGAGPIWRGVMDAAAQVYPPQDFPKPDNVFQQTVCDDDGTLPSDYCLQHSTTHVDYFVSNPPPADQGLYRELTVDTFSGLLSNQYCDTFTDTRPYLVLPNPSQLIDERTFIRTWLATTEKGQAWLAQRGISADMVSQIPPDQACGPDTPQPTIAITSPQEGSTQSNVVTVYGTVDAPNFAYYRVEFGVSNDPIGWGVVQGDTSQIVHDGVLGQVDLTPYDDGPMTIRLIVYDTAGHSAETRVHFTLAKATPTPEPTGTPRPTKTPAPTTAPTVPPTVGPTDTPIVVVPLPADTPTPTP